MPGPIKGRGAAIQPANPYLPVHLEADLEQVEPDEEYLEQLGRPPTEYLTDESQSIVSENNSPDVGFRYSVNPYRGCSHGCSYCYARPGHEYLGMSAGLDFETKVLVKFRAAELLREFLAKPGWRPETIAINRRSGNFALRVRAWKSRPSAGSRLELSQKMRWWSATLI